MKVLFLIREKSYFYIISSQIHKGQIKSQNRQVCFLYQIPSQYLKATSERCLVISSIFVPSVFLSLSPLLCLFLCYILPTHLLQLLQCNQFLWFCPRHLRFWLLIPGLSHCHKAHEPSDLTSGPDLPPSPLTLTSTWPPQLVAGVSAASHRPPGFTWLRL